MNLWWPIFVILGCTWVLPLAGMKSDEMPWFFFVAIGCLWTVLFLFTRRLYDLGTALLRRIGWTAMAEWRERMKPRILNPVRLALLIMGTSSFLFALV